MRPLLIAALLCLASACGRGVPPGAEIVVAGDSIMAWNRIEGASVADGLEARLGQPVGDVSLPLARVTRARGALSIPNQLTGVSPTWVVLDGGGNDLRGDCGCNDCGAVLDRLLSPDGRSGAIAELVAAQRAKGARVLWADYYTSPIYAGTICRRPYDVLAERLTAMAEADPGVVLADMGAVMPPERAELFAPDRLHPSPQGSARIAAHLAEAMRAADPALR
ncbi:SGNH/GDSL hydrolase family protein [Roseivivax sp.]